MTVLGDAIHPMSPGRGDGANTALRDADLLRMTLVEVFGGRVPLLAAIAAYEDEMLRYGFDLVDWSRDQPFAPAAGSAQALR